MSSRWLCLGNADSRVLQLRQANRFLYSFYFNFTCNTLQLLFVFVFICFTLFCNFICFSFGIFLLLFTEISVWKIFLRCVRCVSATTTCFTLHLSNVLWIETEWNTQKGTHWARARAQARETSERERISESELALLRVALATSGECGIIHATNSQLLVALAYLTITVCHSPAHCTPLSLLRLCPRGLHINNARIYCILCSAARVAAASKP